MHNRAKHYFLVQFRAGHTLSDMSQSKAAPNFTMRDSPQIRMCRKAAEQLGVTVTLVTETSIDFGIKEAVQKLSAVRRRGGLKGK